MSSRVDPSSPSASQVWYFRIHGLERGPVGWDALQDLAHDGTLRPSDQVRCGEAGAWVLASQARSPELVRSPSKQRQTDRHAGLVRRLQEGLADGAELALSPAGVAGRRLPVVERATMIQMPASSARPAGAAVLALALSLAGLFVLALPLGLLSLYLAASSARQLFRQHRPATFVSVAAAIIAAIDISVSFYAIGRRSGLL